MAGMASWLLPMIILYSTSTIIHVVKISQNLLFANYFNTHEYLILHFNTLDAFNLSIVRSSVVNNYIVRSYRVVIVASNIVTMQTNKAQIIVMY